MILLLLGCTSPDTGAADTAVTGWWPDPDAATDPFADAVISFVPGDGSGHGADALPDVVTGPPSGNAAGNPSLDVLSLGNGGAIVLEFVDYVLVDGEGADLTVFENPMEAWKETGFVAVSADGEVWSEFPCDPIDEALAGCAGTALVFAGPGAADPTDPTVSGGDVYDLADLGLAEARFVRITDTGANTYSGATGGFDLDALVVVNGRIPE
jgi:hypothetical protein